MDLYSMPGLGAGPQPVGLGGDPAVGTWQAAFDGIPSTEVPLSARGLPAIGEE